MSGARTYAAAVGTPNNTLLQPQHRAQALSDLDTHASSREGYAKHQGPGAEIESKTSPCGSSSTRPEQGSSNLPGRVTEVGSTGQIPRSEHKPNTENGGGLVYVLTLKIDKHLSRPMNDLRKKYFPKNLNRTPAHLTLFHALPHSQFESLEAGLLQASSSMEPFLVSAGKPFRMRKGVGVNVDVGYKKIKDVHGQLRWQWLHFLSEQDAGGFRPHWTVMNKVDDEKKVDDAFVAVRKQLSERNKEGQATGLDLWRYNRGRWEWANEYPFGKS
ncbi:Nn.00g046010.m01.CDS01 [Neocucurbitaria sp. VM-36]